MSFAPLAKSLASLFLLGQIQSKPQVVPAAAAPQTTLYSWVKSYQTIAEHQILNLIATKFTPTRESCLEARLQEKLYL